MVIAGRHWHARARMRIRGCRFCLDNVQIVVVVIIIIGYDVVDDETRRGKLNGVVMVAVVVVVVVHVVGARLGKSGGSLIQQGLFFALNTAVVGLIAPYVAIILVGIIFTWIVATRSLNKQFLGLTAKREEEKELKVAEPVAKVKAPAETAPTT